MTTRINVNVDQQALLQRSREQTQANRWAFLEGQNRSKVGKEAERQRDANRAARGLTADGSMYNNRLRQPPQRPDPAAFRMSAYYELQLQPTQEIAPKTFQAQLKTAKVSPVQFIDQTPAQRHYYSATGGPNGGVCLRCYEGDAYPPRGVAATSTDLIFDTSDVSAKRPDFTVDLWAYVDVPGGDVLQDNLLYAYEQVKTGQLNTDSTANARMRLEIFYKRVQFDLGPSMQVSLKRRFYNSGTGTYLLDPVFTYLDYDPSGASTGSSPSQSAVAAGGALTSSYSPVVLKNTWNHFAIVRKAGTLCLFINGKKLGSFPEYTDASSHLEPLYDCGSLLVGATFTTGTGLGGYTLNNGVARVRVRKKAFYTTDFAPTLPP